MFAKKPMMLIRRYFLLVGIILGSCQDPYDASFQSLETYESSVIADQITAKVARNIAMSLPNAHVRKFIKEKALEKFDGDYNFLIAVEENTRLTNSSDFSQFNFGNVVAGQLTGNNISEPGILTSIREHVPLLQVALRQLENSNPESWDISAETLVAFIPQTITDKFIPAYDSRGSLHKLKTDEAPNSLTLVISENERLIAFSDENAGRRDSPFRLDECMINQEPYFEDRDVIYYHVDSYYDELNGCTGGGGDTDPTEPTGCDRDRKSGKDRLNKMIFSSNSAFKQVNDWFDGGQELEVTIFFALPNGSISKITKVFYGSDHDFRDCGIFNCSPEWFGLGNTETVTWDKALYGDAMLYLWTERDPGNPVKISASFSVTHEISDGTKAVFNAEVSKTITNNDDLLGESIVEYCDNTDGDGYLYTTGAVKFYVRQ